jgi:hypothetical protein
MKEAFVAEPGYNEKTDGVRVCVSLVSLEYNQLLNSCWPGNKRFGLNTDDDPEVKVPSLRRIINEVLPTPNSLELQDWALCEPA